MTSPALPLGFDCEANDLGYCQAVLASDPPKLQFPGYCPTELTGSLEKLPCEEIAVIANLAEVLVNLTGFTCSDINLEPSGSGTHEAESDTGYVETNKSYVITVQLANQTKGTYHIELGDGVSAAFANGVTSFILDTGSGDTLKIVGVEEGGLIDGVISNVSIQCIRYSQIFDIESSDDEYEFSGSTKICKTDNANVLTIKSAVVIPADTYVEGKVYKISFKITGNTCNTPGTEIAYGIAESGALSAVQVANGFFELEYTAGNDPANQLVITLPACFDGCIEDITVYRQNEIRMGSYTKEKVALAGPEIAVELVDGNYLGTLDIGDNRGCIRLGYADACDDYYGQFSGSNIITLAESRSLVNIEANEFYGGYTFTVGEATYLIYRDFVKPGITFKLAINVGFAGGDGTVLTVTAICGGTAMTETSSNPGPYTSGTSYLFEFEGVAGEDNKDLVIQIVSASVETDLGFVILDDTSSFLGDPIDFWVDQDEAQFIPQYYSECLDIVDEVDDCDFVKIEYSNSSPVFGIDFQQTGFGNAFMYIQARFWHPNYDKSGREVYESAGGNRQINYSETKIPYNLTTGYIPEYLITALILAADCDYFAINGLEVVSLSESVSPEWNKSFTLQTVEMQFIKQNQRFLKSA